MGSEATGTSGDEDDRNNALTEDDESLSPEVRRELERRRLSQEEKRVATAAAEYRQRLERGDRHASAKASSIQNRVRSLLDDSNAPVQKTAEGYGKYTDLQPVPAQQISKAPRPIVARKPVASPIKSSFDRPSPRVAPKPMALRTGGSGGLGNNASQLSLAGARDDEDWETNFAKRYPSLSGIEMVETEIGKGPVERVRDV